MMIKAISKIISNSPNKRFTNILLETDINSKILIISHLLGNIVSVGFHDSLDKFKNVRQVSQLISDKTKYDLVVKDSLIDFDFSLLNNNAIVITKRYYNIPEGYSINTEDDISYIQKISYNLNIATITYEWIRSIADLSIIKLPASFNMSILPGGTVYIKTDFILDFILNKVIQNFNVPFKLITHESDYSSPMLDDTCYKYKDLVYEFLNHPLLIGWWGCNMSMKHPKLHPIPLGIYPWDTETFRIRDILHWTSSDDFNPIPYLISKSQSKQLLYVNINVNTNIRPHYHPYTNIRSKWLKSVKDTGYIEADRESWIDFMKTMSMYKFVLCPPGNGIDTHRLWETLLVGSIPIIVKGPAEWPLQDLPYLAVEPDHVNWSQSYLDEQYQIILKKLEDGDMKYDKLWTKNWMI